MPPTLLFVDDNNALAKTATQFIGEMRPEWRFLVAGTCAEARKLYHQEIPDLAILDVELPDGNGLNLLCEFKLSRPDFPVIIISGAETVPLRQEVEARGGYSLFSKPFSAPALVNDIESAIPMLRDIPQVLGTPPAEPGVAWRNPFALAIRSTKHEVAVLSPEQAASHWFFRK